MELIGRSRPCVVLLHGRNAVHHLVGEQGRAFRPGVHDLVVFLALGDQAVEILLLIFLGEVARFLDDALLRLGHDHVVLAEGNAGLAGLAEAQRHDPVAEDHRLLLPAIAVDGVDHSEISFFVISLFTTSKGILACVGQQLAEHHAARRGVEHLRHALAVLVIGPGAALDLGVQRDRLGEQRVLDLAHVRRRPCPGPARRRAPASDSRGRARCPATAR